MYNILDITGSSFSCRLVFYMEVVSMALYTGNPETSFPFYIPFSRLLICKVYSVTNFKIWWAAVCCLLCVCLNLFSSKVFLAMARGRQCDSRSRCPDSRSPRNHCMGSSNRWMVNWDLFHRLGRRVFQWLQGLVSHSSWLILG